MRIKTAVRAVRDMIQAAVLDEVQGEVLQGSSPPAESPGFTGFIKHANEVRKRAKKAEKAEGEGCTSADHLHHSGHARIEKTQLRDYGGTLP